MSYPQDLLGVAVELLRVVPETQATLRRSVSTAYYALFHLIIETACMNWPKPQRGRVARQFDHKRMKEMSAEAAKKRPGAHAGLTVVATTFVELQQNRHLADYDLGIELNPEEVAFDILQVEDAFAIWEAIKDEPAVQDYLFSLLFNPRA
jgi:hypothetical protein